MIAFSYFGGKNAHKDKILPLLNVKHITYVEPFGGSAAILLNKPVSEVEVYNDLDKTLYNFFNVLRDKPDELIDLLRVTPHSRMFFNLAKEDVKKHPDPVFRAAAFFVLVMQSIGSNRIDWSYGISHNKTKHLINAVEGLEEVAYRIRLVTIENLKAITCIEKYDTVDTLFYVDPPYVHSTRGKDRYQNDMNNEEHYKLLRCLNSIKGKCLLSGYDNWIYEKYLSEWEVLKFNTRTTSTIRKGSSTQQSERTEILWINQALYKGQMNLF